MVPAAPLSHPGSRWRLSGIFDRNKQMANPIDFISTFLALWLPHEREDRPARAAAHGRSVNWRPILLGVVAQDHRRGRDAAGAAQEAVRAARFRAFGAFPRCALQIPEAFLIPTQHAARAFYWLEDQDPGRARAFAHAAYRGLFVDGGTFRSSRWCSTLAPDSAWRASSSPPRWARTRSRSVSGGVQRGDRRAGVRLPVRDHRWRALLGRRSSRPDRALAERGRLLMSADRTFRRICVFCGSRFGERPAYREAAQGLGRLLAGRGIELVTAAATSA